MVTNIESAATGEGSLYATVSGAEGGPDVILLHGLFGMGSNLGSLGRVLAPEFRVHQVDLPNHGRSPWHDAMSLQTLAGAIKDYAREHCKGSYSIVGHSLGGKVAMELALEEPALAQALVVADIAPVSYPGSHDDVFAGIEAVAAARPASRREASTIMERHVEEPGVVQFLLLSLRRDASGNYLWRFNARALKANYEALREAPARKNDYDAPTLFVYGTESTYMEEASLSAAKSYFPQASFVPIVGAGHWLHAEKPDEFNAAVRGFLLKTSGLSEAAP